MTMERIRDAILSEARQEAGRIEAEARERHDRRLAEALRDIEEEFGRRFEQAKQRAGQECARTVLHRRTEHNMLLLKRRNDILDEIFDRAAREVASLPDDEYRQAVAQWMAEAPEDAAGEVLCAPQDAARLEPLLAALNKSRAKDAQLRLVPGERPQLGGVVFRTEKFEVDLSLETRIAALRQEMAPKVAETIFPPNLGV